MHHKVIVMHSRSLNCPMSLPLLIAIPAFADEHDVDDQPINVPAALVVPDTEKLAFGALGVGVQIYDCKLSGGRYQWVFRAPEATLYELDGDEHEILGIHYAGPTWDGKGGTVVGVVAARVNSPDPNAIPWL